jgi:hypothetical protein
LAKPTQNRPFVVAAIAAKLQKTPLLQLKHLQQNSHIHGRISFNIVHFNIVQLKLQISQTSWAKITVPPFLPSLSVPLRLCACA